MMEFSLQKFVGVISTGSLNTEPGGYGELHRRTLLFYHRGSAVTRKKGGDGEV
jgi:hypothetical protein